ncbi:hypothetical protein HAX54_026589 [Datura stramonium]|uniref:Secreted protein n=1 Tax=Datura stramonium TaxID=4076 RepID=A0ABS8V1F9_DATST|nr:hypothetical protein [Datura stramonium]
MEVWLWLAVCVLAGNNGGRERVVDGDDIMSEKMKKKRRRSRPVIWRGKDGGLVAKMRGEAVVVVVFPTYWCGWPEMRKREMKSGGGLSELVVFRLGGVVCDGKAVGVGRTREIERRDDVCARRRRRGREGRREGCGG